MAEGGTFDAIRFGGRGTSAEGTLNVSDTGIVWKKSGGTHPRSTAKENIAELIYSAAPAGGLLRVRRNDEATLHFHGFTRADEPRLMTQLEEKLGLAVKKVDMSLLGHNWGKLSVHGKSVAFSALDGKHVLEVPLDEVAEVQGAKEDAIMEFHVDDAALRSREDALTSVTFVLPEGNTDFPMDVDEGEEAKAPAEVFRAAITTKTDALTREGEVVLASLDNVSALYPRGRYELSLFPAFMDMDGPNHQYKIRYTNVERIYTLPRPQPVGNLVIVHLENAMRRGQTYYEWICFFFDPSAHETLELGADEEFIAAKNKANKANMERNMSGATDQLLTRLLRGLSGAKVTKSGSFRAADGHSPFLGCSYRNDAGILYPLERAFLYTFKPELIPYDHIDSVEFERQQSGMHATSLRTFDLSVTIRPDAGTRTKHFQFRSIQKHDWEPLLTFLEEKKVRVLNLEQARQGPGVAAALPLDNLAAAGLDDDEDEADDDFGNKGEDEDEDEAFDGGSAGSGSDSDSGSDAELIAEEGISVAAVTGKPSKRKQDAEDEDDVDDEDDGPEEDDAEEEDDGEEEEEAPKKKARKKEPKAKAAKATPSKGTPKGTPKSGGKKPKDKNAPKRGMSGYMFFSNEQRPKVKEDDPGISFADIAKKISEKWKALSDDEKAPYNEKAKEDKARYEREMAAYKAKQDAAEKGEQEADAEAATAEADGDADGDE